MTKKIAEYYKCEECNMLYTTSDMAKKCEAWCKKHGTCNVEITKHAVGSYGTVSDRPLSLHLTKKD
jgi:uncharacterized paraquat-inducible protein A